MFFELCVKNHRNKDFVLFEFATGNNLKLLILFDVLCVLAFDSGQVILIYLD